ALVLSLAAPAPTSPPPLPDALPIFHLHQDGALSVLQEEIKARVLPDMLRPESRQPRQEAAGGGKLPKHFIRSLRVHVDEQISLQIGRARLNSSHVSISYAVFCLKKK